ncbi:MAG: hypothetical protein CMN76_03565 [Spirochaetaceae bacterium]|nr:hypothetical protein [Spirochaetaceae bacterium]
MQILTMRVVKMKDGKNFGVADLSFKDLKVIKDACALYGTQGSVHGKKIAEEIEKAMEKIEI